MDKVTIINSDPEDIFFSFGINKDRMEEFASHLSITYNKWNKSATKLYSRLLLNSYNGFTKKVNEIALISYQLGQIVCKIRRLEKKDFKNPPWDDSFFEELGITSVRKTQLVKHLGESSRKWGAGGNNNYSTLIEASCSVCIEPVEVAAISCLLGYTVYKMQILAGEV
jgi:hypothetical protein